MTAFGTAFLSLAEYRDKKLLSSHPHSVVLETHDPAEQQSIGQNASGFVGTVWNGVKQTIAFRGLLAKISQNEDLKKATVSYW